MTDNNDLSVSVVDIGKMKIIVRLPQDMLVLDTYSAQWKFKFSWENSNGGCSNRSLESYPVKMPNGDILISMEPGKLICQPGAIPLCYLNLRVVDQQSVNKSSKRKQAIELISVFDLDGNALICEEAAYETVRSTIRLIPDSREFNIAELIGEKSFKKIAQRMRNFLIRERK